MCAPSPASHKHHPACPPPPMPPPSTSTITPPSLPSPPDNFVRRNTSTPYLNTLSFVVSLVSFFFCNVCIHFNCLLFPFFLIYISLLPLKKKKKILIFFFQLSLPFFSPLLPRRRCAMDRANSAALLPPSLIPPPCLLPVSFPPPWKGSWGIAASQRGSTVACSF